MYSDLFDPSAPQATGIPDEYDFFGAIANDESTWALFDDKLIWDGRGWSYGGIHQSPLQDLPLVSSTPKQLPALARTVKVPRRNKSRPAPLSLRPLSTLSGDTFALPPGSRRIGQGQVHGGQQQTEIRVQAIQINAASMSSILAGSPGSSTMQLFQAVSNSSSIPHLAVGGSLARTLDQVTWKSPDRNGRRQKRTHQMSEIKTVSLQQVECFAES